MKNYPPLLFLYQTHHCVVSPYLLEVLLSFMCYEIDILNLCISRTFNLERQLEACPIVITCFTYLALTSGSSGMVLAHYAEGVCNSCICKKVQNSQNRFFHCL